MSEITKRPFLPHMDTDIPRRNSLAVDDQQDRLTDNNRRNSRAADLLHCPICKKTFKSQFSLKRHAKIIHSELKEAKRKCPVCNDAINCLHTHLKAVHDIEMEEENLQFPSFNDFQKWKQKTESDTKSSFMKARGTCNKKNVKRHYFVCHRSGNFVPKGEKKRRLKINKSCKINAPCPAQMKVLEMLDGTCDVNFIRTHVGHQIDIGHLRLTNEEKERFAEKIASGVSFKAILDDVKESLLRSTTGLERQHLLTRKDLHNIVKSKEIFIHNFEGSNLIIDSDVNNESEISTRQLCNSSAAKPCTSRSVEETKKLLEKEFLEQLHSCTTQGELEAIKKIMAPIQPTLAAMRKNASKNFFVAQKRPHGNKKIEPQRRLFSTKKKRSKKEKPVAAPSGAEAVCIATSLLQSCSKTSETPN